ncbi:hypothetical protein CLD20_03825 [Afifella sp. IM 167]|nr:hypothetical protein [Afifella sp. IM 167]
MRETVSFLSQETVEISWQEADASAGTGVAHIVFFAPCPAPSGVSDLRVADLMQTLDTAFLGAADIVREASSRHVPGGRILFLLDWTATGLAEDGAAALLEAGLTGLARSWSRELAESGFTANVIVTGPIVDAAVEVATAHAVAFFLHAGAEAISGQVLVIAGSSTTGMLPI